MGFSLILYLVFAFSATQGPVKELRLSFMSGEKYFNKKYFYFFQGLRALCYRIKRSKRLNYRLK